MSSSSLTEGAQNTYLINPIPATVSEWRLARSAVCTAAASMRVSRALTAASVPRVVSPSEVVPAAIPPAVRRAGAGREPLSRSRASAIAWAAAVEVIVSAIISAIYGAVSSAKAVAVSVTATTISVVSASIAVAVSKLLVQACVSFKNPKGMGVAQVGAAVVQSHIRAARPRASARIPSIVSAVSGIPPVVIFAVAARVEMAACRTW